MYTFAVDEAVKGDFGETVKVRTASEGSVCGLDLRIGRQTGLFLSGDSRSGWTSSLCQLIFPEDLREAAAPMPEPNGEGPIEVIAAGNWGEMGLFALDSEGRTLMYGERKFGSSVTDVCPGSDLFIEVPWRGTSRWVIRRTATFEVLEVIYPPVGLWPETCVAEDASEILAYDVDYDEPISRSVFYRFSDGLFEKLYEGSSSGFDLVGDHLYLTEGRYGRNVKVLDLSDETKSFIARLPGYVQGVAVSADEMYLATTAGADREKLIVIDRTTSPATVRVKHRGIGRSGEVYWLDNSTFVYLPGGYDNTKVKVLDTSLDLHNTLSGWWYTLDEEVLGNVAYGAGWGSVFRATLPEGPSELLREFPSPEIYSVVAVPDEVFAQTP